MLLHIPLIIQLYSELFFVLFFFVFESSSESSVSITVPIAVTAEALFPSGGTLWLRRHIGRIDGLDIAQVHSSHPVNLHQLYRNLVAFVQYVGNIFNSVL